MDSKFITLKMGEAYELKLPVNINVANEVFNKLGKELLDVALYGKSAINVNMGNYPIKIDAPTEPQEVERLVGFLSNPHARPKKESKIDMEVDSEPCMSVRTVESKPVRDPDAKFTFYKCPECGKFHYGFTKDLSVVNCYECQAEIFITHEEGEYTCPSCGYKARFRVGTKDVDVMKCKECKTEFDMKYHEGKKKYMSLNMIK